MELRVDDVAVHFVEHGDGTPVVVLHGAGVDHREAEACFEPHLRAHGGLRRIYPDLPGMGRTPAPESLRSAADVLAVLLGFVDVQAGRHPVLLVGHSAGGYYAREIGARRGHRVAGLALICPLSTDVHDVPAHQPVLADPGLGSEEFRGYFVVQTPAMLERYEQTVAPGALLADWASLERIGRHWTFTDLAVPAFEGPTLVVAGRQDSVVGCAAAIEAAAAHPHTTLAVIDGTGHALPHEQPEILAGLLRQWLERVDAHGLSADG